MVVLDRCSGKKFSYQNCPTAYITSELYLQLVVTTEDLRTAFSSVTSCKNALQHPSLFEVFLCFHCLRMVETFCNSYSMSIAIYYKSGSRVALETRSAIITWKAIIDCPSLGNFSFFVFPFLIYVKSWVQFKLLKESDNYFKPSNHFRTSRHQSSQKQNLTPPLTICPARMTVLDINFCGLSTIMMNFI